MVVVEGVCEGCDDVCVECGVLLFGGFGEFVFEPAR